MLTNHAFFRVKTVPPTQRDFQIWHVSMADPPSPMAKPSTAPEMKFKVYAKPPDRTFDRLEEAEQFFIEYLVKNAPRFECDLPMPFRRKRAEIHLANHTRRGMGNIMIINPAQLNGEMFVQMIAENGLVASRHVPEGKALVFYRGAVESDSAATIAQNEDGFHLSMIPEDHYRSSKDYAVLMDL